MAVDLLRNLFNWLIWPLNFFRFNILNISCNNLGAKFYWTKFNQSEECSVELTRKVNFLLIYLWNFNQGKLGVVALIIDVSFRRISKWIFSHGEVEGRGGGLPPVTRQSSVRVWPWLRGPKTSPTILLPVWSIITGVCGGTLIEKIIDWNKIIVNLPITVSRTRWYLVGLCLKSTLQVNSPVMVIKWMFVKEGH